MIREDSSLSKIKIASQAREAEEIRLEARKKNILVLILAHLESNGYINSLTTLQNESNLSLKQVVPADNMDLMTIFQEYESYYSFKFGKTPKLARKIAATETKTRKSATNAPTAAKKSAISNLVAGKSDDDIIMSSPLLSSMYQKILPRITNDQPRKGETQTLILDRKSDRKSDCPSPQSLDKRVSGNGFQPSLEELVITPVNNSQKTQSTNDKPVGTEDTIVPPPDSYESRLLKPMPEYGNSEFRELASIITRDIFMVNPNVRWSDIAGLSRSKRLVRESVIYPLKFPELFTGILSPWKGLLLYGPPGTGKTMLAKAVATECKTTFFNISASSIVSKWRGDSEKLVRVLFELARYHAPSTIFIDELESIMGQRSSEGEHEGSRRMKTEILIQMDGLAKTNDHVFILAASNLPWELDIAMLRRLEKRILIGLPDHDARISLFESSLPSGQRDDNNTLLVDTLNYEELAKRTKGYSGSDIKLVCKEAAMKPLRKLFDLLDSEDLIENENGLAESKFIEFMKKVSRVREPVLQDDVYEAIQSTRPSSDGSMNTKYFEWEKQFGSQ